MLQGDPRQHKSVKRHGNMLEVLPEYAGLPVAELKEIKRQKGDYAKAVAAIRDGEFTKADAILRKLGWIVEGNGHDKLVEEYGRAIGETQAGRRAEDRARHRPDAQGRRSLKPEAPRSEEGQGSDSAEEQDIHAAGRHRPDRGTERRRRELLRR